MKYILAIAMLISLIGLTSCSRATNDTNSTNSTNSTIALNNQTVPLFNAVSSKLQTIINNQFVLSKQIATTNNSKTLKLIKDLQNTVQKIKLYFYIFVGITIVLILSIAILGYYFYKILTKKIYENKGIVINFKATLDNILLNQKNFQTEVQNFVNNFVKENKALVIEQAQKLQDQAQIIANQHAEIEKQKQLIENLKADKAKLKEKYGVK